MKTIVTLTAGLMIISASFAQSSRRSEVKENNSESNNRRSETVNTERRTPSESSGSSRTESYSSSRRSTGNSNSAARTPEVNSKQNQPTEQFRSSRSSSDENRNISNNSDKGKSSRSNNGYQQPSQNHQSVNRGNSRDQVIVHEHSRRPIESRHHTVVNKSYRPVPVEVRRVKYPYRTPVRTEIIWTIDLSRRFEVYYPNYRPYKYHYGMRLASIPAYDAYSYVGEIARVYGRVVEVYYARETDEYFLYFGDYYPYHDFSVVIPGREAREFSRRPERFFDRQYLEITGLVSRYEGKPEMIVRRSSQLAVY